MRPVVESFGTECWLRFLRILLERRHRHRTALAFAAGFCAVHENTEDPRLERRSSFERRKTGQHADPRLLRDFLGDSVAATEPHRYADHRCVVALDEAEERAFVPTT